MDCARNYYCRCCYHAGELEMISGPALDVYTLIFHHPELKDDATQIFACGQCCKFLEEVHYFRDERRGEESGNLNFKPHEVDIISRHVIDENSAKVDIKSEIIDEDAEMDQIDIQINKIEVYSDPETSQQMSETSRENLLVSNVEKSEIEDHNSLNIYENNLLIERRAIPYIEMSKSIKRLGKVHEKNHNGLFKCNECSYETKKSSNLKKHILCKHSDKKKPFICDHCDYKCYVKFNLYIHLKKHFPKYYKSFKCNECLYEGTTMGNLKIHIQYKHSDERPFSCDQCDSRFKTKQSLSQHINTHLRKRDKFKCNECSYEGTTASKLKYHISYKHSDERPFSCNQCDSRFKRESRLSKHINEHLTKPEKPFKCNQCSYETIFSSRLKSHISYKHSDERPFSCDQCDFRFKTKTSLFKHVKTHFKKRDNSFECN